MRVPRAKARRRSALRGLAFAALALLASSGDAQASLSFSTAPALPTLPAVTLNGKQQTVNGQMTNFAVSNTNSSTGWNLTVAGQSGSGLSAVFAQYCPNATCGTDTGPGYVTGGNTLPANSLTLNTTGATWTSGTTKPAFQCNSGCFIDHATATKVVSAPTTVTTGTLTTTGFSATSLSLATSSTLKILKTNEVYRVNVVWTLNTGP